MATAVNEGPVTLADVALHTTDKLLENFVKNLIRESKAMASVPFITKNVLSLLNKKWKSLPAAQRRLLNEGYTNVKGTTEDETWEPSFYGLQLQIDTQLENLENSIVDEVTLQTDMAQAGFAADWTYDMFNGDRSTSPKAMIGLKKLVTTYQASRQTINVGSPTVPLDATSSAATEQHLINALHKGLKYVGRTRSSTANDQKAGKICIYANEIMYLGISALLRASGLLETTSDQFGRMFNTFMGFPIIDVGLASDQSTEVITNTEDAGDGANNSTSIYIARWDKTDGLIGVQKQGMSLKDPLNGGEMESVPAHLLRLDWGTSLVPRSDFCVARIKGIKDPSLWTNPA